MRPRLVHALRCGSLVAVLLLPPLLLAGQVPDEQRYAPEETLGCDFVFAVFAPVDGEPRIVRRCPGGDGGAVWFASRPVLELIHLDSVAAVPARPGSWRVDVRLTGAGARRLGEVARGGLTDPLGVVLDGRVVARFTPRSGVRSDRLTVLAGVPEPRARAAADRLRTEARRASMRRDGGLWRFRRIRRAAVLAVIAAQGPRVPSHGEARRDFRLGTIVLSAGRMLAAREMAFFDRMAARGEAREELRFTSGLSAGMAKPFFLATGGRATLSTEVEP